jgi:glycosyltransferase involved in cell wall biosynthesis
MNTNNKRLQIAFLAAENPHDKRNYSGSLYYMGKALEKHCGDVTYLERIMSIEKRYIGRLMHETSKRVLKKNIAHDRLLFVAKKHAKISAQRLAGQQFDVIFAPNTAPEIAFLRTNIPILLALDVTFRLQHNYYPQYSNLLGFSARQAEIIETRAFQNASELLFSSPWASRSAIEDYGVDPGKVHAYFFGANIDSIPSRESILAKQPSGQCRLLFIGIGWKRKGGDIAFETLLALEKLGISAELIVCGTVPPPGIEHEHMTVIPYLDKNDEQQSREIEKLYALSDFLILPTRADCAPNVFKEGNAFGLPAITTRTGGVADVVIDGENGYTLPLEARGEAYASLIAELYVDRQRYLRLVKSSRDAFDERLSWDAWGSEVGKVMHKYRHDEMHT